MITFLRKHLIAVALLACALAVLLLAAPRVSSQSGGAYDLTWNTIDGGGITFATGGSYQLGGTIGAADAGTMGGGAYVLAGGFWSGAIGKQTIYLPSVRR
jgi:hypothetical protein